MAARKEHLTILSEAEQSALYDVPDYDNEQRLEYLSLTNSELQIALDRHNISAQIYCILQFGYFKAVKLFFRLTWDEADQATISFIIQQYFENQDFELQPISKYEHYSQCKIIATMYGYRSWAKAHEEILYTYAEKLIRRDMNQKFIAIELLDYLQTQ